MLFGTVFFQQISGSCINLKSRFVNVILVPGVLINLNIASVHVFFRLHVSHYFLHQTVATGS